MSAISHPTDTLILLTDSAYLEEEKPVFPQNVESFLQGNSSCCSFIGPQSRQGPAERDLINNAQYLRKYTRNELKTTRRTETKVFAVLTLSDDIESHGLLPPEVFPPFESFRPRNRQGDVRIACPSADGSVGASRFPEMSKDRKQQAWNGERERTWLGGKARPRKRLATTRPRRRSQRD